MKIIKQILAILLVMIAFIFFCVGVFGLTYRLMTITEGRWYEFPVFVLLCLLGMGISKIAPKPFR